MARAVRKRLARQSCAIESSTDSGSSRSPVLEEKLFGYAIQEFF